MRKQSHRMKQTLLFLLVLQLMGATPLVAQTCCSGGVPMSGNLGLPVGEAGTWQVSISYDLNVLNTLKDGTTTLQDNTRKRTTHSLLTEVGYTINDKWSFDGFFSFVRQERKLTPVGQQENFDATNGIGDAVLLLKYRFYKNFQVGLGLKIPMGPSDLTNDRGLTLNADLQPGSGAWDMVYWLSGSQPVNIRPSMSFNTTIIYRATGQNNSYFGTQVYEFGNEFQALVGLADRITLGALIIDPALSIKYRTVSADRNDGFDVPSTGGKWLFLRPALSFNPSVRLQVQANIELPVYAELEGTQVTPTYRFNTGILFRLQKKKDDTF